MAANQEKAFVEIIKANQRIIHKVCLMYADDADERQDLFQEVVLQLWRSFSSFRGEAKISTWIYRIALNIAISGWRKQSRRIQPVSLHDHHYNVKEERSDEKEESIQGLYDAIRQLSSIERALIMLYLEDLPYEEIAQTMGITQNNARVKISRAKDKLKKIMTHGN